MKALVTLTAAVLILCSVSVSAKDGRRNDTKKEKSTEKSIKAPKFVWGEPVAVTETEMVKVRRINYPEFQWGAPTEVNLDAPARTVRFPEFNWGTADEISESEAGTLKVQFPAFEWGTPEEIG